MQYSKSRAKSDFKTWGGGQTNSMAGIFGPLPIEELESDIVKD